jgi:Nickel responsive protein SCO4226-like
MFYAAKCYWPGVTETELETIAARATENSSGDARHGARYLGSLLFRDDELVLCMFEAPSPLAVKRASEQAGIPCERVMDSLWLAPPPDT